MDLVQTVDISLSSTDRRSLQCSATRYLLCDPTTLYDPFQGMQMEWWTLLHRLTTKDLGGILHVAILAILIRSCPI